METLKISETLIQGLVASKQDEIGNLCGGTFPGVSQSFDLGKVKCVESAFAPVAESCCVDSYKVNGVDRVDSSSHGDVSIKGISLFVELTGGVTDKPDVESIRNAKTCLLYENRVKVDVGQQEPEVNVGDLVWAVINNKHKQLWWPGIVCDAANAPKEAANRPMREDDILVRCFGKQSFIWCSPYEVKPFVGYFDQLPNQSNAKKYLDALEKAVTELGHRVKTEFTCSCSSGMKMLKTGHLGDLSVTRFEPAKFLDYMKDLGKSISMPQKIDYVVKQNCLSAFYRSLGHLEIPMHQLEPANGSPLMIETEDENGYFDGTEKSCETRARRKSNDLNHGSRILDFQNVRSFNLEAQSMTSNVIESPANQDTVFNFGDLPLTQRPPCKFVPIRPRKIAENITSMHTWNADTNTLPNVNQMEALYHASVFYFTNEFGSTQPYFTGNHGSPQAGPVTTGLSHVPKKRGRKRKNIELQCNPGPAIDLRANPGSTPSYFTGNHGEPQVGLVPTGLSHAPKKRGRKRKNIDLQANPGSTIYLQANTGSTVDLQANPGSTEDLQTIPGSTIILNLKENITGQKKQKGVKRSEEVGVRCIDLSYNKVQQGDLEVKGTAFLLKFSSDYPLPSNQDLNSAFSKFGELIESETQVSIENLSGQVVFLDSSGAGGAFWGLQNDKPFGPVLVNYKVQHLAGSESMAPFKTPIKCPSGPKPMDSKAISPTIIPEMNTNSTEIHIMKRSKTIEEFRPPSNDSYLSYSKVHHGNEEATGTALLLKFSPNHPIPSFQDLNLVFCKYGELNELETRVSGQDFTGQVVFLNPSTAGDAIHRLEKDRPFGPALLSYRVHHLYSVQPAVLVKNPVNVSLELKPPQDLVVIKKNLEMMNLMLEKSGDSLSPEMRGKLENEIKGLMNKVSAMDGSSSSSCL